MCVVVVRNDNDDATLKIARLSKMFLILVCVFESNKWDFSFFCRKIQGKILKAKRICAYS